jgi:AraC family transcriptional regulator
MLTYSLRANTALRTHASAEPAFGPSEPRSAQSSALPSMNGLSRFNGGDQAGLEDHAVHISPSNAIDRRAVRWNGGSAEVVQATTSGRIEFGFHAPFHLLIAYEQGIRRDGETFVEGLPSSKLREVRRRLTFVPAGHQFREWQEAHTPGRIAYFYFDPARMHSSSESLVARPFAPLLFFEDGMLWDWMMKAAALVERGSANQRYCEALGTLLAHELERINTRPPNLPVRGGLAAWQQRMVTDYVEEHLAEPISLNELAQLVRRSVYHFCRAFKKSFGVPPHRYHTIRRIERAKSLLAEPACSVTEIGLMLGFSETSSFTAAFRRMTGLTPTAYRRSVE